MNIAVPVKLVPDLVEELNIDSSGTALDPDWLRLMINEFDDHAIEQALILQDGGVGKVTVIAMDDDCAEDVLFTAAAKGVDRIIKLSGDFERPVSSHRMAKMLKPVLKEIQAGLILTGVQAHNDLDGPLGPLLAENLGIPYVGYVAGVKVNGGVATILKEFPGGLVAEMEVYLPAVLGIQAAESPPRYIAFSKIRQAMKTMPVEEKTVEAIDTGEDPLIFRMYQPESSHKAEIIEGNEDLVANRLLKIFVELGVL
jgi:electron transfer flavoprotein beta subunit